MTCPACLRPRAECDCSRWCAECGCVSNHTTRQHQDAEALDDGEGP